MVKLAKWFSKRSQNVKRSQPVDNRWWEKLTWIECEQSNSEAPSLKLVVVIYSNKFHTSLPKDAVCIVKKLTISKKKLVESSQTMDKCSLEPMKTYGTKILFFVLRKEARIIMEKWQLFLNQFIKLNYLNIINISSIFPISHRLTKFISTFNFTFKIPNLWRRATKFIFIHLH